MGDPRIWITSVCHIRVRLHALFLQGDEHLFKHTVNGLIKESLRLGFTLEAASLFSLSEMTQTIKQSN